MVVATGKFEELARQSAGQVGLSGARIVSVEHPVGGVAPEALDRRADGLVESVIGRFLAP